MSYLLQICIQLFTFYSQGHCNLLYSGIVIALIIGSLQSVFFVKISIQYFSPYFSIKVFLEALALEPLRLACPLLGGLSSSRVSFIGGCTVGLSIFIFAKILI